MLKIDAETERFFRWGVTLDLAQGWNFSFAKPSTYLGRRTVGFDMLSQT